MLIPASGRRPDLTLVPRGGPDPDGVAIFVVVARRFVAVRQKQLMLLVASNAVEVVGSFVKLMRQQNKKKYEPTLSALDALAVASFIFLSRSVTPPIYVGFRILRARSVS